MDEVSELRNLLKSLHMQMETQDAEKVENILRRLEKTSQMQEKKYNRAIQDRQAVHSLLKKTSDDLVQRYRTIFEHSGSPMVVIEKDGTIILANTLFCTLTGQAAPEIEKKANITDYLAGDAGDPLIGGSTDAGGDASPTRTTTGRINLPGGKIRDILISMGSFPGSSQRSVTIIDVTERNRLEQELVDSETYLTTLMDSLQAGVLVIDATTHTITDANPMALAMIRVASRDDVIGKRCHQFICPALEGMCPITDMGKQVENAERVLLTCDGQTIPIIKYVVPVMLKGRPHLLETFVDNSERKKMEQALQDTSDLLTGILKASPVGFHKTDPEGRIVYINEMWSRITGLAPANVLGRYYADMIHPDDREELVRLVRASAGRQEGMEVNARIIRPDGTVRWISAHAVPLAGPGNEITGWVGAIRDITGVREAEEALRKSEEQLRRIADSVPGVVYQFYARDSGENGIYFVSRQSTTIFGIPDEPGRFFDRFIACIPAENREKFLASIAEAVSTCRRWEYQGRFQRPDGQEIFFHAISEPLRMENETVYFGVLLDVSDIQKAQEAVEKSEAKYRFLIENTSDAVYAANMDGTIVYMSPQASQLGYDPLEVIGKNFFQFIHPDDRDHISRNIRQEVEENTHTISLFRVIDPRGNVRWVEENGSVIRDAGGKPTGIQGVLRDVTARKRAEDELRKSEFRFRDLADLLPQIIFEMDTGGKLTYANASAQEVFGITEPALRSGMNAFSIIVPEDRERAKNSLRGIIAGKGSDQPIYTLVTKEGRRMIVYLNVGVIVREGEVVGFRGSASDISELKRIEEELHESREKYRMLAENTPDLHFSADVSGSITYVSPQIRHYGFTAEDVVGKSISTLIYPADRQEAANRFYEDIRGSSHATSVFRILDKEGVIRWVEQKTTMIPDERGAPHTMFGVLRDITERKKAEAAIELANRKLNLMNNITRHDILNTVTGIFGCVDMLRASHIDAENDQLLADIKDQVRVIQRQITFTKEYQEVGIRMPQWQNVRTIIGKVLKNFENPPFAFSLAIGELEVYADPLFEKVIYNLVDNSVRYAESAKQFSFSTRKSEKTLIVICEDDGVGVTVDQKERIFERGIGRNTGMGLFLTREILEITGISIYETGVPGKGARFEIHIPPGGYREPGMMPV